MEKGEGGVRKIRPWCSQHILVSFLQKSFIKRFNWRKGGGVSKIRPWLCKEFRVYAYTCSWFEKGGGVGCWDYFI